MSLGSRMQIRYTHKLSMYKADFFLKYGSLRDVLNGLDSSKFSFFNVFVNSNATLDNLGALCVHVAQITCAGVRISSGLSCCVNRPL